MISHLLERPGYFAPRAVRFCILTALLTLSCYGMAGSAVYSELDISQYVVTLTTAEGADPETLETVQSLTFTIIPNRLSKRKWGSQWTKHISINHAEPIPHHIQPLVDQFKSFPQSGLTTGDKVRVLFDPSTSTRVTINDHQIFETRSPEFYSIIKRTMIGQYPPSRRFKEELLGLKESTNKAKEYAALTPTKERIGAVRQWTNTGQISTGEGGDSRRSIAAEKEAVRLKKALEEAEAKRRAEAAKAAAERQRLAIISAQLARKKEQERQRALAEEKERREELRLAQLKKDRESKERKFALDNYQYQVIEMLYKRVEYPTWARKFEIEGVVDLTAKISVDGEIVEIIHNNPQTNKKLVKEVESRLRDIVAFIPMPSKHIQTNCSIRVEYRFDLRDPTQKPNPKPNPI